MGLNMVIDRASVLRALRGADRLCIGSEVAKGFVTIEAFGFDTAHQEARHLFTMRVPVSEDAVWSEVSDYGDRAPANEMLPDGWLQAMIDSDVISGYKPPDDTPRPKSRWVPISTATHEALGDAGGVNLPTTGLRNTKS